MWMRIGRQGGKAIGLAALAMTGLVPLASGSAIASDKPADLQTLGAAGPSAMTDARPLIVNGAPTSIRSVPWQVYITSDVGACGGVIVTSTRVITAAHCIFDPTTYARRPVSSFTVRAGISNFVKPAATDAPQSVAVAGVRVHPGYVPSAPFPKADDVAVLELKTALNLTGPAARAIPVATTTPGVGTAASITGFGQQRSGTAPNGQLYALGTGVADPLACVGPDNALMVCVASATGSACNGDSGGPMTVGAPATLAGVTSSGGGLPMCQVGSLNAYTNLAAPEIAAFVAGSNAPPLAPRGGAGVGAQGVFQVGGSLTCLPGAWTNGPTFAYAFVDNVSGAVLQSGPSATYVFQRTDLGRSVACHVAATTAGGTGVARTVGSPPIAPAPAPDLALSVRAPKRMIKLGGAITLSIRVLNRGSAAARRVIVCDSISRGMAFERVPRRAKRSRRRVCWRIGSLRAGSGQTARVTLRTPRTTRVRRARTTVTVRARKAASRRTTIRLVAHRR